MPFDKPNSRLAIEDEPLGIYVHLPWCVKKCPYCDFNSHVAGDELPEAEYVRALVRDLDTVVDSVGNRTVSSLYFGGGTPSLFSAQSIGNILDAVSARLRFDNPEVTLEANPGTAEAARFRDYALAGVNRLSIGAQSFDNATLQKIGRVHDGTEALAAAQYAHDAGIDNFNLDLMFAQPGQTVELALSDIRTAIACAPTHLSCYQLTIEPNTLFHAKPPRLPDEDRAWQMQEALSAVMSSAGFVQYEVSAWARPGRTSRHNSNYWTFGDYVGIGAGAHAKITLDGEVWRSARKKHPARYLATAGTDDAFDHHRVVPEAELGFEYMLNALRLNAGFALADFEQATGLKRDTIQNTLDHARARGLLEADSERVIPSALGRRFLNDLVESFL